MSGGREKAQSEEEEKWREGNMERKRNMRRKRNRENMFVHSLCDSYSGMKLQ